MYLYDTIIIGKGPAGISASLYLKRAGLNVLVVGKDIGTLDKADIVENYYGFSTPISGKKLFNAGIRQAKRLGIEIVTQEVVGAEFGESFTVKTLQSEYMAKSVLFAIGKKRRSVSIKGISQFEGSGVSYCAVCDGFFYKNKNIAIIGSGEYALSEARFLKGIAASVTVFTDGADVKVSDEFAVIKDKILEVKGNGRAEAIVTDNGEYKVDGIFVAMGSAGTAEFALKLGLETNKGNIVITQDFATNLPGIYAAGDCVGGFLQIAKAVSDGAQAANSIIKYVKTANKSPV